MAFVRRLYAAFTGSALAFAAVLPETYSGAACAAVFVILLVGLVRQSNRLKIDLFICGAVFHLIAFYWLPSTLSYFGGFPFWLSLLFFVCFVVFSSLQFVICGVIFRWFSRSPLAPFALALPFAWFVSEFLYPRMFPWTLAHTLLAVRSFTSLAEFFGAFPLSAILVWWGEIAFILFSNRSLSKAGSGRLLISGLASIVILIGLGAYRNVEIIEIAERSPSVNVALIQGNLEAKEKGDIKYFEANLEKYRALSKKAEAGGAEIIFWPESVFNTWINDGVDILPRESLHPYPSGNVPIVFGGLGYKVKSEPKLKREMYNAAFALIPSGEIIARYYKRVLMPFGEYLPFSDIFPSIKNLSPHSGDFTKGHIVEPMRITVGAAESERTLSISMLICYEDLVSSLPREGVGLGSNILVNLTNDAWYGDSPAAKQHHMLAAFRAIETRRYLLRVTNTGFTGVIDARGVTLSSLPMFTEDYLPANVHLLEGETLYARVGDLPSWVVVLGLMALAYIKRSSL